MHDAYQLTDTVKLLQKIVLIHQGKFLVLQRSPAAKTRPHQWDLPGGNVMWPATQVDLKNHNLTELHREIQEETGFDLDFKSSLSNFRFCHFSTFFEIKTGTFAIIVGFRLNLPSNTNFDVVKISPEHIAWDWISVDEFNNKKYDFGFAGELDGFITQMVKNAAVN